MKTAVPGLIIRPFELKDLHDIYVLGLEEETFRDMNSRWNPAELAEVFSRDDVLAYTAARKKETCGFIIGNLSCGTAGIQWIMVKEKFRRKGVGSSLLAMFKEKSKKSGVTDFFVALFPDKTETEAFFYKHEMLQRKSFIKLSGKI